MKNIWAIINAENSAIAGMLAAEALKSAAKARNHNIEVMIITKQGALNSFDLTLANQDDCLLLVDTDDKGGFKGENIISKRLDEVLTDVAAIINLVEADSESKKVKIVAITSCPTGIAHTFMAAEGLLQGAKDLGYDIRVETQGSVGARDELTPSEISEADIIIIAADREVERDRFNGKRVFMSGTKPAINDTKNLINKALKEAALQAGNTETEKVKETSNKAGAYKHLMNGISFMLPFIVAGGLLIALAFAFGGIHANDDAHAGTFANSLFVIGAKGAFSLIVPILAGYIAFSIANRPGLAPGMVGGVLAANIGAGFIGGIIAGFIAGYVTNFLSKKINLPKTLEGLKPILILPLLGTLITGLLMIYVVGKPVAGILTILTAWLHGLQGANAALLGIILAAMMCADFGGPINKASYAFSTGLISAGIYTPMAASMAGGMVPPIALGIACYLFRNKFTNDELESKNAVLVLGSAFISEGAIPFAARDPMRVIPACMIGGGLTGAITMLFSVGLKVPHGGIFILPIPGAVTNPIIFLSAVLAGSILSALIIGLIKKPVVV